MIEAREHAGKKLAVEGMRSSNNNGELRRREKKNWNGTYLEDAMVLMLFSLIPGWWSRGGGNASGLQ
jgi:hypothetical protein